MFQELVNPSFAAFNFFQIEELITRFMTTGSIQTTVDSDIILLHSLLLPFTDSEWSKNAASTLVGIIEQATADQIETPYYLAALKELQGHVNRLEIGERREAALTIIYTAYHLAFYEYSEEKLAEVGWLFKSYLADNVDPQTRGAGSYPGYIKRLQAYVGSQLAIHKDLIRQTLWDAQTKSVLTIGEPELVAEQALQPTPAAIVPLSQILQTSDKKAAFMEVDKRFSHYRPH